MITAQRIFRSAYNSIPTQEVTRTEFFAGSGFGDHPIVTPAPTSEQIHFPQLEMSRGVLCEDDLPMPVALTGRQKLALSLEKAQYTHAEIAALLKLKHRETATRLLMRARAAEKALVRSVESFLER